MQTTIFGPPGTGKTTTLINIVKKEIQRGTPLDKIAFVSFSRKAADEAKQRAVQELNVNPDNLTWFRTLHSLAFQYQGMSIKDVMKASDYRELGRLVGLDFSTNSYLTMADGGLFAQGKGGDAYLGMIQIARVRGWSLEEEFNYTADYRMHFQQARIVDNALRAYKKEADKKDFVDMIEEFVEDGEGPSFDVLIVDEAQDLAPLQWRMVREILAPNSKRVYYAGDDDQCIYTWMGVNVKDFLRASEEKQILTQSYRVPQQVHDIAASVVNRIDIRQDKQWKPASHTGTVVWHRDVRDVDLDEGQWLVLARTNYIANNIARELREDGYVFYREGSGWSISPNILQSIETWLLLCKGSEISTEKLWQFCDQLRKGFLTRSAKSRLKKMEEDETFTLARLVNEFELQASEQTNWYDIINVSETEEIYISSARRRNEKILTGTPRIKISTIHKAKGGEADNVLLILESSKAASKSKDQDAEKRTFYVGITRAKKELHLVEAKSEWGFYI